ncbi:MAG: outer membrane beta-barrel protein [Williamsia sp.]|nr:outer membrane beta-barrel protein [Williamsia sp.]
MKKHLLGLLACVVIGFAASAQTEAGNYLAGGNFNLNTAKNDFRLALTPSVGYFIINNLAAGANVDLEYSKVGSNKTTVFGIGPFARYYLGTLNIRPFAHANVNFTSNRSKNTTGSDTYNGSNYFLGAGLAAFINRNVAVEGLAGYSHSNYAHLPGSGGFNLRIGFQIYLSKEQVASVKSGM